MTLLKCLVRLVFRTYLEVMRLLSNSVAVKVTHLESMTTNGS